MKIYLKLTKNVITCHLDKKFRYEVSHLLYNIKKGFDNCFISCASIIRERSEVNLNSFFKIKKEQDLVNSHYYDYYDISLNYL